MRIPLRAFDEKLKSDRTKRSKLCDQMDLDNYVEMNVELVFM